jgi:tetratricopeptide (TPR) repeat protein
MQPTASVVVQPTARFEPPALSSLPPPIASTPQPLASLRPDADLRRRRRARRAAIASPLLLVSLLACAACGDDEEEVDEEAAGKIHASTVSNEALELYREGQTLQDNLRRTEAFARFERAIEHDPEFALAHLGAAQTSPSGSALFTHLERAIQLADLASEGEKHLIYTFAAAVNTDPVAQERHARALVETHPQDERAHLVLGNLFFGRQDYAQAVEHYRAAIAIDPSFAPPYNQLGYSHRFLGDYAAAEEAFEAYIALIPDEPNPYDSYAELLMKAGRFEESIEQYRKALERDPGFVASQIGIGLDQLLLGQRDAAFLTFEALLGRARDDAERRQALAALALGSVAAGETDAALGYADRSLRMAQASGDAPSVAADLAFMGRILLDAGRLDEASERFAAALETIESSGATAEVKRAQRHNQLYNQARIALARGDLAAAGAAAAAYGSEAARRSIANEARAHQELLGRIALAREDWATALDHLGRADQQSPTTMYLLALAHRGAGDEVAARRFAQEAASWNALGEPFAFVRRRALALLDELPEAPHETTTAAPSSPEGTS